MFLLVNRHLFLPLRQKKRCVPKTHLLFVLSFRHRLVQDGVDQLKDPV